MFSMYFTIPNYSIPCTLENMQRIDTSRQITIQNFYTTIASLDHRDKLRKLCSYFAKEARLSF